MHDVLCAWCQKEGSRTVIDRSEAKDSHGICDDHMTAMLAQIKELSAAECSA